MSPVLRPLRKREVMPDFVRDALEERGLRARYDARPPYQRNDYLLWINKVKRDETRQKHLAQMLDELEAGNVYMGMRWNG
ncbi:YdeI/OmpD-associated family protein [Devosia sp.]|uniref:YdeI/OmpD-associated family protein n=1 Tax=Devosia sp. TaxID=1871048 RepID=UPI00292CCA28|nr:YdeI/OmpD-associated family protein [Devosia sp.]